uniref:Uncharacterized protein n=1 Tax=Timema cristinae TaxID=61476 RepID=A0A7R9DQZ7_TIMCR|nr:unnamed protein product [Timema cristinae]
MSIGDAAKEIITHSTHKQRFFQNFTTSSDDGSRVLRTLPPVVVGAQVILLTGRQTTLTVDTPTTLVVGTLGLGTPVTLGLCTAVSLGGGGGGAVKDGGIGWCGGRKVGGGGRGSTATTSPLQKL